jgi:hypothetical protein
LTKNFLEDISSQTSSFFQYFIFEVQLFLMCFRIQTSLTKVRLSFLNNRNYNFIGFNLQFVNKFISNWNIFPQSWKLFKLKLKVFHLFLLNYEVESLTDKIGIVMRRLTPTKLLSFVTLSYQLTDDYSFNWNNFYLQNIPKLQTNLKMKVKLKFDLINHNFCRPYSFVCKNI